MEYRGESFAHEVSRRGSKLIFNVRCARMIKNILFMEKRKKKNGFSRSRARPAKDQKTRIV